MTCVEAVDKEPHTAIGRSGDLSPELPAGGGLFVLMGRLLLVASCYY